MDELRQEYKRIIERDGKWSAHNFIIKDDFFTIGNYISNDEFKLTRVVQNIRDLTNKDFSELKILDLACLEGMFGLELARQGANVTLLDVRDINIRKVQFAVKALGLNNVKIVQDDVRQISVEKYGSFDVILCFGIFYHLDKDDLGDFVKRMYEMCERLVFFDTHITPKKSESFAYESAEYFGASYQEHRADATEEEKMTDLWKSRDNQRSFKMTRVSLVRLLNNIGFSSVFESHLPFDKTKDLERISLLAVKGKHIALKSTPLINSSNNYHSEEISNIKIFAERLNAFKNSCIYYVKLKSPRFIRTFYKKYIKREGRYKK